MKTLEPEGNSFENDHALQYQYTQQVFNDVPSQAPPFRPQCSKLYYLWFLRCECANNIKVGEGADMSTANCPVDIGNSLCSAINATPHDY